MWLCIEIWCFATHLPGVQQDLPTGTFSVACWGCLIFRHLYLSGSTPLERASVLSLRGWIFKLLNLTEDISTWQRTELWTQGFCWSNAQLERHTSVEGFLKQRIFSPSSNVVQSTPGAGQTTGESGTPSVSFRQPPCLAELLTLNCVSFSQNSPLAFTGQCLNERGRKDLVFTLRMLKSSAHYIQYVNV